MKLNKRLLSLSLSLVFPILFTVVILLRKKIMYLANYFPKCKFYELTGCLCPACGNTRSVSAILNGKLFTAIGYNVIPVILLILFLLMYAELLTFSIGSHVKIMPRNSAFYYILIAIAVGYWILRNFLSFLTLC